MARLVQASPGHPTGFGATNDRKQPTRPRSPAQQAFATGCGDVGLVFAAALRHGLRARLRRHNMRKSVANSERYKSLHSLAEIQNP